MRRAHSKKQLPDSTLKYILESIVPYSDANLKLAFKPHWFFIDLENIARRQQREHTYSKVRSAYYRAVKKGYITLERGRPQLTARGLQKVKPYVPKKLRGAQLMVIFDIPESERHKRRHLRVLLKELKFRQIQKSVWVTDYDYRDILKMEVKDQQTSDYVLIYEVFKLKL